MKNKIEWPKKKKFVLCLTHDVDRIRKTYQHLTHFLKTRRMYHLFSLFQKNNPYWNFPEILKLEKKLKVKSTFFFLNEKKKLEILNFKEWGYSIGYYDIHEPKICRLIKSIHKKGWEIAVHGSFDSFKNKELLIKEKNELEEIVGDEIKGIRQHLLNLSIPLTWKLQMDVGFKYDSSFGYSSKFGNKIGFRKDKYIPFFPFKNKKFLVIPVVIMDNILYKYKREEQWSICKKIIDISEKNNAVLTILWHTHLFNEKEVPNSISLYKKIINECKEREAWITNCKEIYEWVVEKK